LNDYELVTILHPDIKDDDVSDTVERLNQFITGRGGEVREVDQWGRRRLAYPIARQMEGTYVVSHLVLQPANAAELEANLRISEDVLRHLLVRYSPAERAAALAAMQRRRPRPAFEEPGGTASATDMVAGQTQAPVPSAEPEAPPQAAAATIEVAATEDAAVLEAAAPAEPVVEPAGVADAAADMAAAQAPEPSAEPEAPPQAAAATEVAATEDAAVLEAATPAEAAAETVIEPTGIAETAADETAAQQEADPTSKEGPTAGA